MNLGAIRTAILDVCRDSVQQVITNTRMDLWINEAQLDVASRTRIIQEEVSTVTVATTIALPEDLIEATRLRFGTDDAEFVDDDVWWSWSDSGARPKHTLARVWENAIEVYPIPTIGTAYRLRYARRPVVLTAPSQVPEIPVEQHPRLVNFGRAEGLLMLARYEDSLTYRTLYERDLPDPGTSRARIQPGPLTISVDPGPFDLDPDRRHT